MMRGDVASRSLSTSEAANVLGISANRVRQLIAEGRLPAEKPARDWLLKEKDVRKFRDLPEGRRGRPRELGTN
jgi:excisionase family DNA binding protein